jgi:CRP/FNR family transcriptional regulator
MWLGRKGEPSVPDVAAARDAALRQAIDAGFLGQLPAKSLDLLLSRSTTEVVPAGTVCFRATDRPSRGGVVLEGVFRVYVVAADGRRLTVRYARTGALAGLTTALTVHAAPVNVQAITDGRIQELPLDAIRELAPTDPALAWALAQEVSLRLLDAIESLASASFGTMRGRLARHLLDLASESGPGRHLTAHVTQQDLADGLGTVREVVARLLGQLREEGYLATDRGAITILEPDRLASLVGAWTGGRLWATGARR